VTIRGNALTINDLNIVPNDLGLDLDHERKLNLNVRSFCAVEVQHST